MKTDLTTQYLNTINYGNLPIRYNKTYLNDEIINIIQASDGTHYEIRKNQNGKLVALLSE